MIRQAVFCAEVLLMFLEYYELNAQPFDALSHPAPEFQSRSHRHALNALEEALRNDRGNPALLAEAGAGKTMLLKELQKTLCQQGRDAYLFEKHCAPEEILRSVLSALGVHPEDLEPEAMLGKLNEIWFVELLAGKRLVLLFDDAEQLGAASLETIRQLCRYETSKSKLFQIVFCGRSAFLTKLEGDLRALQKRITQCVTLEPLSAAETAAYIRYRLLGAGRRDDSLFSPDALTVVAQLSNGFPQDINRICSRALLEAYARGLPRVTADIVEKAERNLSNPPAVHEKTVPPPVARPAHTQGKASTSTRVPVFLAARAPKQFGLPGSGLWLGAAALVLLSAGFALPRAMHRTASQQIKGGVSPQIVAPAVPPGNRPGKPSSSSLRTENVAVAERELREALAHGTAIADSRLSLTRELGLKINRIVIDPGHGGFDTGAKGPHGLLEKDLCLDVALRLGRLIEENVPGDEVVYTRKDDRYVPLEERTTIANGADADLFISIHANSSESTEVRGVETYYLSLATSKEAKELAIRENALSQESLHDLPELVKKITNNEKIAESKLLALEIQGKLSQRLQLVSLHEKNRGVRQAPFIVLTGANMPAVLSEISFISNANDESLLLEGGQRQRIAEGLYHGISAYLDGLQAQPQPRQKLVTENRSASPTFRPSMMASARNPL